MRYIVLLITALLIQGAQAQSLYDLNTIQDIRIYFGFSDWDYRMDTAKAGSEGYILADSVVINGMSFVNCGVKYKGNSSYNSNRAKNPLHIKLDKTISQNYQGYEDIKLGNGFSDNSMVREPLAYQILRQYMDAPLCNFAKLYINGNYYGVMSNTEDIGDRFLLEKYFSTNHTFIKCNPQNAGPGSGNGSNLAYNGTAISSYDTKYELKSDTGWYELMQLCDTLNNKFSAFNSIADIDRFLWMLAFNNVTVNLDSYSGSFRQNYYLYRNHAGQWIPTIWDLNMSFGGFSIAGGTTSNLTPTSMQTMSYTLHKSESGWPLIYKLLNDPVYGKMYEAHMRTINNENFANASYKAPAQAMQTLVNNAVQTDPNYLSTYANFQVALTTNTTGSGGPGGNSPGIFPLMDGRASYLSNVLSAAPPVISNVTAGVTPQYGAVQIITAQVANSSVVYLGYRYSKKDRFVRVPMFDDGAHGDGIAGDNIFGASVSVDGLLVQYYVYAENSSAGAFSPERAEYEFYEFKAQVAMADANTSLVLNEVTASNTYGLENEKGKAKDWIEILNKTSQTFGLHNLYLSDDPSALTKWRFPEDAYIEPGAHLLVWADDLDNTYVDMHTNFNLSEVQELLFLTDGSAILDSMSYANFTADYSYSRCAEGAGPFTFVAGRTARAVNDCASSLTEVRTFHFLLYPNPVGSVLQISASQAIEHWDLTDMQGRLVRTVIGSSADIADLPPGMYHVRAYTLDGATAYGRVVKL